MLGIFLENPPDGAGHGLKCIESKNRQHFYFKNFLRPSHPSVEKDLSLKIEVRDQTIQTSTLEL